MQSCSPLYSSDITRVPGDTHAFKGLGLLTSIELSPEWEHTVNQMGVYTVKHFGIHRAREDGVYPAGVNNLAAGN